jgi:tetratricopeptide (TPR) repeat protein
VRRQAAREDSETDEFQLEVTVKAEKKIFFRSSVWWLGLLLVVGPLGAQALAQTSGNVPVPEYYGTYAVADGKLIDLGSSSAATGTNSVETRIGKLPGEDVGIAGLGGVAGGRCDTSPVAQVSTESLPEMPSDVQFLLYAQASGPMGPMMFAQGLKLSSSAYVRNVQVSGCSPPKTGVEAAWDLGLGAFVKLRLKPVPSRQDMVLAVPSSPLKPGVYLLEGEIREALSRSFVFAVSPLSDAEAAICWDLTVFPIMLGGVVLKMPQPRACGNAPAAAALSPPAGTGTPRAQPAISQPPAPSAALCDGYDSCFEGALAAIRSSDWQRAIANFEAAANQRPNSPDPWNALGLVYLGMGRQEEAPAMLDKGLSLGRVSLNVCHEVSFSCQQGTMFLGSEEISFTRNGRKEFAVPASKVTPVGVVGFRAAHGFRLRVEGKNYNFDFLPLGVTCDNSGIMPQCPEQGAAQQLAVANYVLATLPKLASGAFAPQPGGTSGTSAPNAPSSSPSANLQLAEQVKKMIASYETPSFHSPLDDEPLLQSVISESQATGVSLWLLFGQAKFETTFGDPINATVQDGRTFTDGSTGNAHNLFNIRPGTSWAGKVLDTGSGGRFRVYASYEDSIRDYLSLMSSNLYKGKSLDSLINTYFPPGENGPARVEEYITTVIQTANKLGFTIDRNTVPVP